MEDESVEIEIQESSVEPSFDAFVLFFTLQEKATILGSHRSSYRFQTREAKYSFLITNGYWTFYVETDGTWLKIFLTTVEATFEALGTDGTTFWKYNSRHDDEYSIEVESECWDNFLNRVETMLTPKGIESVPAANSDSEVVSKHEKLILRQEEVFKNHYDELEELFEKNKVQREEFAQLLTGLSLERDRLAKIIERRNGEPTPVAVAYTIVLIAVLFSIFGYLFGLLS